MVDGREGDWECSGCKNRNYAFRSFCNRCKQPRILVDTKTPPDSKWLPRIGDWICTGCTNNNYASREKCKKCGQPKEVAAMPATAIPGVPLPTYSHYFARAPGGLEQKMSVGLAGNGTIQLPPLGSMWSAGGLDKYGVHAPSWPLGGAQIPLQNINPIPKGWRNGDWMCNCGFHNYSSRTQCKNCNASVLPALGTKRLASEEPVQDSENKRVNLGNNLQTNGQQQTFPGFHRTIGATDDLGPGAYATYLGVSSGFAPNWQGLMQFPHQAATPALLGKGAKQWRSGDWMCTKCDNHNYASRSECNRCKVQRDAAPGSDANPKPDSQPIDAV